MGEAGGGTERAAGRGHLDLERGWVPLGALVAVVALPILLAVVDAARSGWVPTFDGATIVHRSYDMWSSHRPLVGQYSLASGAGDAPVFSPGPFLYLVLAPAARFGPAWSVPLTLGVLATGCFAIALCAARQIGGWWFAVAVAIGLVGTVRASGAAIYIEPWNPWASLAPFAALVMVCWLVALGRRRWFPVAVVTASFIVQSHLTYVAPSLVLLAIAVVGGWWPDRPGPEGGDRAGPDEPEPRLRPALTALAVGLACWALPIYEQVTSSPGNLRLVSRAASGQGETFGSSIAVNVWWRAAGPGAAFTRTSGSMAGETVELVRSAPPAAWIGTVVVVLAVAALGWVAARHRVREVLVGALISLGLCVAALATTSRLPADRFVVAGYALRWVVTAGLVPWLVAVLAVLRLGLLARWRPEGDLRRGLAGAALALLALVSLLVPRVDRSAWARDPVRTAGDAIVANTAAGDRVLLAHSGTYELLMAPSLAFRLRQDDRHPVLVRGFLVSTGASYGPAGVRCDAEVYLLGADDAPPRRSRLIAVLPFEDPGNPRQLAVYLVDDTSPGGDC